MKRKQLIALLLTAAMTMALTSCDGDSGANSSTVSGTSSVGASSTASYEKPAALSHDGNKISDLGAVTTFDVTPSSIIADQTSLDSYDCEAYWLSKNVIGVFYSYSVETMPNYFEPRIDVAFYHSVSGTFGEDTQISYHTKIAVKPTFVTCDGGFAVCADGKVKTYTAEAFLGGAAEVPCTTYTGDLLLDVCADETGALVPLYLSGNDLYIGNTKVDSGLSSVTTGVIGNGAKTVAVSDGATGVLLDGTGKKLGTADLAVLDNRVNPYVTTDGACFVGKLAGGNSNLTAVTIALDGTSKTVEHLFDDALANTYANARLAEAGGSLYLVTALSASNFDFGNATVYKLDGEWKTAETLAELSAGWHTYHAYAFSADGRLLVTENVADGTEIKDYIHLF